MTEEETRRFRSRWNLRDLADLGMGLLLVLAVLLLYFVLPWLVFWLVTGDVQLARVIASALIVVVALGLALTAPRSASIGPEGLRFQRYVGTSWSVPWEAVTSIREATRWEVFLHVWLWPGLPARGSILCASTRQHYRIEYDGGLLYFPPRNAEAFREAVTRWHAIS